MVINRSPIFVIIIVLTSSIIIINNIQLNDSTSTLSSIENSDNQVIDLAKKIRENSQKVDHNSDKIADYLENRQGTIDAIVLFESHSFIPNSLDLVGFEILKRFSSIPAIHATIDSRIIDVVANIPGIAVIEENLPLKPHLAYSTSQLGVRPYLWDQGIQGDGDYSIAIVDSGIDFTHEAFDGRILASYNALDNNATLAVDNDGHGTHVAGIAAGLPITNDVYSQTSRGTLPTSGFFPDILVANVNESTLITVGMDWGEQGADFPGGQYYVILVEEFNGGFAQACTGCKVFSQDGIIETTFPAVSAGDYYVGFGTDIDSGSNLVYEGWAELTYDSDLPSQQSVDGYEEYSGVAPKANIVAIKVTDTKIGGTSSTFIDAMGWVIANKDVYNITVVNLSIGIDVVQATMDTQITNLANNGIIAVVAAGNDGKDSGIFSPGSAEEAITVGAVNRFNEIAGYSSNGQALNSQIKSIKPDIVAPGGSVALPFIAAFDHESSYPEGLGLIVAPDSNTIGINVKENDLIGLQGTSMASPHIAGLALLLMEKYAETNGWDRSTSDDVFKIKRAILAGTFEVANIGSSGGEQIISTGTNFLKQTPTVNRNAKDFVEGWGAVNAKAALGALNDRITYNSNFQLTFGLEDPFTSNVYAWSTTLSPGTTYRYSANVPVGADIDLLVIESNVGNFGDLTVIESAMSGSSINENFTFSVVQQKDVILVARIVNSSNTLDLVTIKFEDPNFQPNVGITSPKHGSFINTASAIVKFDSASNNVTAFIDDSNIGFINSGYVLTPLIEGEHNLTLVEKNENTGITDNDQSIFTLDLTLPTINSNISLLADLSLEDPVFVNYTVTDDLILDRIEIRVGEIIGSTAQLFSDTSSGIIKLDPWTLPSGIQNVEIRVYDKAGNFESITTSINLVHKTYISPLLSFTHESEDIHPLIVTWNAGTNASSHYTISLDGELMINNTWDGNPISYAIPTSVGLGDHIVKLQVFDKIGTFAIDIVTISIVDNIAPRITNLSSGEYDATFEQTFVFEVLERNPKSIAIYVNDDLVQASSQWNGSLDLATLVLSGTPGEVTEVFIEVSDIEDNLATSSFSIQWIDDTDPVINSPTLDEFTEGNAPRDLEWTLVEKYVAKVSLLLDKEEIAFIQGGSINSLSISRSELNKLSPGTYEFRMIVTDTSNNNFADTIDIKVNKKSDGGFLPSFTFFYFIFFLLTINYFKSKKFER